MCILEPFQSGFRTRHSTKSTPLASPGGDQSLAVMDSGNDSFRPLPSPVEYHKVPFQDLFYFPNTCFLCSLFSNNTISSFTVTWTTPSWTLVYLTSITVILFTLESESVSQPRHTCSWFKMKRYQEKIPYLPSLAYPHWLSVKYRIEFKVLLFVFKALDGLAAGDISELLISTPSPDSQDR